MASTRLFPRKNAWKGQAQLPRSTAGVLCQKWHRIPLESWGSSPQSEAGLGPPAWADTHRHTNHTHPLPNTEKCSLNLSHVCGKENKAASPPPSAPFPYFPSSLQPEFPVEQGINGDSSQCFRWETCSEGISFLRASDLPEKPTLAAGNYFIPATEQDLNPM